MKIIDWEINDKFLKERQVKGENILLANRYGLFQLAIELKATVKFV